MVPLPYLVIDIKLSCSNLIPYSTESVAVREKFCKRWSGNLGIIFQQRFTQSFASEGLRGLTDSKGFNPVNSAVQQVCADVPGMEEEDAVSMLEEQKRRRVTLVNLEYG
jgi:hypothetical protein